MKTSKILLPVLALLIAGTSAFATKAFLVQDGYYELPSDCQVCQVDASCNTTGTVRCLCFFSGDPAFQDSNCTIQLRRN